MIRMASNSQTANWLHKLSPAELAFGIFAERNPLMPLIATLAEQIRNHRKTVPSENIF